VAPSVNGPRPSLAVWRAGLVLMTALAVASGAPASAVLAAERGGAGVPAAAAPAEVVRELRVRLARSLERFEAQDVPGVLAYVSDQYRTGPFTKAGIQEQLVGIYTVYDVVKASIRIDEVRMVGEHAWVYSTGEVSGRLRLLGTWVVFLSWQRELEVARREAGGWRLFGYQQ